MRIAIAQINCTLGDLAGNASRIADFASRARDQGAEVLLTPELSLCGYPPEDLLLRADFVAACETAVNDLAARVHGITVVVGHPRSSSAGLLNAASVLRDGRVVGHYAKRDLPNYTVFDEQRYFQAGHEPCVFEAGGVPLGVNICEDIWGSLGPVTARPGADDELRQDQRWDALAPRQARAAGARALLVLNASPYHLDKQAVRYDVVAARARETGMPVVFCNLVGGQDELVFDGASFVVDARGEVIHQMPAFEESLAVVELDGGVPLPGERAAPLSTEEAVYRALCLGVRDYVGKNGFPGGLVGSSGGIDSALTLCIAADALGPERVRAVMMPSQYTASMSLDDAQALARNLGVRHTVLPIEPVFQQFLRTLSDEFAGQAPDTAEENLQSRIRGTLLMALSNKFGAIVLTTGNKSEMATGYATLYGDMAGGFAVLKDISKLLVYRLARWRNAQGPSPVIPERVITRAPSAELRPDQKDQDSLPPYEILDAIMEQYVEHDRSPAQIVQLGFARADVERVVRLLTLSEYKRRQAPVGVRITPRGFGKDWRFPITNRYRERF
ncbi:MAG: NAD+ synthase [Rhodocyclaceae bacterium]|nr:NAD+ synthase [Rhodocyclaceae bacterium]MCA3144272.1 NAD+ synthase [Rhodocyclaceae bacterium]